MTASPNRLVARIVGAVYLLVGLLGFTVSSGFGFAAPAGGLLFGFIQVNGLQNVVHLLIGVALVLCGVRSTRAAKRGNALIGTFSLVVGLVGLYLSGMPANVLALNGAGNALHFGTAILLLAASLGAEKPLPKRKGTQPANRTR